jgi:hypothetical protein
MNAEHTPYEQANGRRYTVNEAAEHLGISAEAVRARINRGTLHKEKDAAGTVYVRMDAEHTHTNGHTDERTNGRTDGARTEDHAVSESKAFDLMQEQVDYLRSQLEVWQEEARRKDHIIAALTERIPELEAATPEPREATEKASEGTNGGATSEPDQPRSWWRRLFG